MSTKVVDDDVVDNALSWRFEHIVNVSNSSLPLHNSPAPPPFQFSCGSLLQQQQVPTGLATQSAVPTGLTTQSPQPPTVSPDDLSLPPKPPTIHHPQHSIKPDYTWSFAPPSNNVTTKQAKGGLFSSLLAPPSTVETKLSQPSPTTSYLSPPTFSPLPLFPDFTNADINVGGALPSALPPSPSPFPVVNTSNSPSPSQQLVSAATTRPPPPPHNVVPVVPPPQVFFSFDPFIATPLQPLPAKPPSKEVPVSLSNSSVTAVPEEPALPPCISQEDADAIVARCIDLVSLEEDAPILITEEDAAEFNRAVKTWACKPFRRLRLREPYSLYRHQIHDVIFKWKREQRCEPHGVRGGVVQAKMGLGKTLGCLAYCAMAPLTMEHTSTRRSRSGAVCTVTTTNTSYYPTLVVASKTVMAEWRSAGVGKFFDASSLRVLSLHADYMSRADMKKLDRGDILEYDVVLTTYDVLASAARKFPDVLTRIVAPDPNRKRSKLVHQLDRDQADHPTWTGTRLLFGTPWRRVVCDESQRFANHNTHIYRTMMAVWGDFKWCLTGTPIRNFCTDIWAQFRFLGYHTVVSPAVWKRRGLWHMRDEQLRRCLLQVDYEKADVHLPPLIEHHYSVVLDGPELACYKLIHGIVCDLYEKMKQKACSFAHVLAMFTRLRQCCIAPCLVAANQEEVEGDYDDLTFYDGSSGGGGVKQSTPYDESLRPLFEGETGEWMRNERGTAGMQSSKNARALDILLNEVPAGEKVIVFSTFRSALTLLAESCRLHAPHIGWVQVDGTVTGQKRTDTLNAFRTHPDVQVLFLTQQIGAEGLNLTEATHIVCLNPWWNEALYEQSIARAHRIGQTLTVHVYNLFIGDSIEDRMLDTCFKKCAMKETYLPSSSHQSSAQKKSAAAAAELRKFLD